jgi:predicted RNase H-like nuclease (RuvC/YqgF family)
MTANDGKTMNDIVNEVLEKSRKVQSAIPSLNDTLAQLADLAVQCEMLAGERDQLQARNDTQARTIAALQSRAEELSGPDDHEQALADVMSVLDMDEMLTIVRRLARKFEEEEEENGDAGEAQTERPESDTVLCITIVG